MLGRCVFLRRDLFLLLVHCGYFSSYLVSLARVCADAIHTLRSIILYLLLLLLLLFLKTSIVSLLLKWLKWILTWISGSEMFIFIDSCLSSGEIAALSSFTRLGSNLARKNFKLAQYVRYLASLTMSRSQC